MDFIFGMSGVITSFMICIIRSDMEVVVLDWWEVLEEGSVVLGEGLLQEGVRGMVGGWSGVAKTGKDSGAGTG